MNIYQLNFKRLERIFGKDWQNLQPVKLKSGGFMDLHFEKIADNEYAMAHYFEQNGDLVPDPDMTLKVFPELQMVEALSYQDSFGYQAVYPDEERRLVNMREKISQNKFLSQWLLNLIRQGFRL